MPKIILSIFEEIGGKYRALIGIGENAEPKANGRIVYQDGKETKSSADLMNLFREMKEKAQKWAREQGILFVYNIDINPHE